mmetsp:Transcript_22825/g.32185  ORF Transcript_22825/g.32185 Transcript_22825/m.32185 type:complete len:508 (-) Transcript_22825:51-1574(-)
MVKISTRSTKKFSKSTTAESKRFGGKNISKFVFCGRKKNQDLSGEGVNSFSCNNHTENSDHGRKKIDFNTTTSIPLFLNAKIMGCVERILYLWAIKHLHRSSILKYTSEMTFLVIPLMLTFFQGHCWGTHLSGSARNDQINENTLSKEEKFFQQGNLGMEGEIRNGQVGAIPVSVAKSLTSLNTIDNFKENKSVKMVYNRSRVIEDEERAQIQEQCISLFKGQNFDEIVSEDVLDEVEADTYWCLDMLVNKFRGIPSQKQSKTSSSVSVDTEKRSNIIHKCTTNDNTEDSLTKWIILTEQITSRVNPVLHHHFKSLGVDFAWFTSRWIGCLLVRDLNVSCVMRLWDTLLSEEGDIRSVTHQIPGRANRNIYSDSIGFRKDSVSRSKQTSPTDHGQCNSFHSYVCTALLSKLRKDIIVLNTFEEVMYLLQNPPTNLWSKDDMSEILGQAYIWKETFRESEKQLLMSTTLNSQGKYHWPPRKSLTRPQDSVQTLTNIMYNAEGEVLWLP